jgi:phosphoenolpyruvate synthase/pyruvate phosphate dikinase
VSVPTLVATRWVYDFTDGARDMRALLGGKGANVAEMTRILGPGLVPAGFTITTEACVAYMDADQAFPAGLDVQVVDAVERLEERAGKLVCGEHAGDPDSIDFFHHSGIDYVSCSPFRIPVARVAAAQTAVRATAAEPGGGSAI